ncbi:hypothetical protein TNCV_3946801 [Trichonephila clavipes]|nr:hypothetical protein TNCV_3946801 [Trichonephila clavipes]
MPYETPGFRGTQFEDTGVLKKVLSKRKSTFDRSRKVVKERANIHGNFENGFPTIADNILSKQALLKFVQSSKNIFDADSEKAREMYNAVPVLTSSRMRNIIENSATVEICLEFQQLLCLLKKTFLASSLLRTRTEYLYFHRQITSTKVLGALTVKTCINLTIHGGSSVVLAFEFATGQSQPRIRDYDHSTTMAYQIISQK